MRTASSAAISLAFAPSNAALDASAVATVASNCCLEMTSFSTSGVYRFRSSCALMLLASACCTWACAASN